MDDYFEPESSKSLGHKQSPNRQVFNPVGALLGMLMPGTIDVTKLSPVYTGALDTEGWQEGRGGKDAWSTLKSMSIGTDRGEVLLPTIDENGQKLTDEEAVKRWQETGRHLGLFDSPESATRYTNELTRWLDRRYKPGLR